MSAPVFLYALTFAALAAGAAWCFDGALRALGRPTRWIWMGGMGAAALAPLLAILFPSPSAVLPETTVGVVRSMAWLPDAGLRDAAAPASSILAHLSALDGPILVAWLLGSGLLLLLLVWTGLRLRRELSGWELREVGGERVLVSRGLGPAVIGLFRPSIVLPPWALEMEDEKLRMVLLHEAEHRQARDPALLTFGTLLAALNPLNPGLWWMLRRLRLAVEADCDARVLGRGAHPKRYGRLLLEVATLSGRSLHPAPALVERGRSFLERRLTMIRRNGARRSWPSATLTAAGGGVLVALACQTPIPPNASEEGPAPVEAVPVETADPQGKIVVRGRTLGEIPGEPLILVNGVRLAEGSPLMDQVTPGDIESIEVLKGSRAQDLYGERAAEGAILITLSEAGAERLGIEGEAPPVFQAREVAPTRDPVSAASAGDPVLHLRADSLIALPGMVIRRDTVGGIGVAAAPGVVIRTRDTTAASGGEPLYVVDGVIVSAPLAELRPEDIASIEVIKGAAAAALYGARAANGVILITTKK